MTIARHGGTEQALCAWIECRRENCRPRNFASWSQRFCLHHRSYSWAERLCCWRSARVGCSWAKFPKTGEKKRPTANVPVYGAERCTVFSGNRSIPFCNWNVFISISRCNIIYELPFEFINSADDIRTHTIGEVVQVLRNHSDASQVIQSWNKNCGLKDINLRMSPWRTSSPLQIVIFARGDMTEPQFVDGLQQKHCPPTRVVLLTSSTAFGRQRRRSCPTAGRQGRFLQQWGCHRCSGWLEPFF